MYFFSRTTFMYRYVVSVSPFVLYGCSLFLLILMSAAWWFLLYSPLRGLNEQYVNQLAQLHITVDQLQSKSDEGKHIEASYGTLRQQLRDQVQDSSSHDQHMMNVFGMVSSSGLFLTSYMPLKTIDKKWYDKKIIEYCLQGSFENILAFFEQIAQSNMFIQCKQFMVSSLGDGRLQVRAIFDFLRLKSECCSS